MRMFELWNLGSKVPSGTSGGAAAATRQSSRLRGGHGAITSTIIRVKGEGLLRKGTKSAAGQRTLALPMSAVAMLRRRFMTGARLDQPLFPSLTGVPGSGECAPRVAEGPGRGGVGVDYLAHVSEDYGDDSG